MSEEMLTEKEMRKIQDLKWFYDVLRKGGKTADFYESQSEILKEVIIIFEKMKGEAENGN